MPRLHRLAGALALSLGFAGAAQAQTFSGFYAFGDSLSDSGNIAQLNGLPAGNAFTTNPDRIAVEIVANYFGLQAVNSLAGGTNFAWGGACVNANPAAPCLNPVPRISTQIDQYFGLTGGSADPNALYSVWGGANDIFATLALAPGSAQANTQAAAVSYLNQIGRLQAAGANYIVVYNLPNLGITPQFRGTAGQDPASQLTYLYNTVFNTGLAGLNDGIIAINTYGLIEEIIANPGAFGFTNVTGTACTPANSVACGPAGSGLPATYPTGANNTFLFADGVHPTGAAHAMLANVVLATIAAPVQFSMAGEAGIAQNDAHVRSVNDSLLADFGLDREVGSVRGYTNLQFGDHDYSATAAVPGANGDSVTLTAGANWRSSDNVYWGVALSIGNTDTDTGLGSVDGRSLLGTLHGTVRFGGGGYVTGAITGGSTNIDVRRDITLGTLVRTEEGSTNASLFGGELAIGWLFGEANGLQHGPFASASYVQQDVDGYAEEGGSASSMNFAGFSRDSMVTRVGYLLQGSFGGEGGVRPYVRVAYNEEGEDDQVFVNAGSNSMNGRFTMPGFTPSQDWVSAELGVSFPVGDATTVFAGYNGRFSDDQQDGDSFNLGVRMTF